MNQPMWIATMALVVATIVRSLKTETVNIALANYGIAPLKRSLPWIALVLGAIGAALDAKVSGVGWQQAAASGAIAAATAVFGHDMMRAVVPSAAEPPRPPGPPMPPAVMTLALLVVLGLVGCTAFGRRQAANSALDAVKIACIIAAAGSDDATIRTVCKLDGVLDDDLRRIVNAAHARDAAMARERNTARGPCPVLDAGAP